MPMQRKPNHDNVVAVGDVNDAHIQVIEPPHSPGKYVWRIIREGGRNVTSGMISYTSIDAAFEAAVQVIIPDAVPVEFTEPTPEDFLRLNMFLFGFKKSDPISSFAEAMQAHNFLVGALETLRLAKERMPSDYDEIASVMAASPDVDFGFVATLRSLQALATQQQEVMIELCERDLETLAIFIGNYLHL